MTTPSASLALSLATAALEASERATPGPWGTTKGGSCDGWPTTQIVAAVARGQCVYASTDHGAFPEADRHFIAHARTALPQLAAWVVGLLDQRGTGPLRVNHYAGMISLSTHHPKMDGSHVKATFSVHNARVLVADLLRAIDRAANEAEGKETP